ncbi:hypothetical protein QAD02_000277 [Eretmocerus hayati]|uniref:Uncharacterized protein n=1 Tax=Eretmocerus hayati TaxID=131215 RepID=A0ACC2NE13_9HYME|nr:hypothetical protein QAD02_000277 [Eretmocerus hayati]
MDAAKPKLVVSFVEKAQRKADPQCQSPKVGRLIAIGTPNGGKSLVRLGRDLHQRRRQQQHQSQKPRLIGVLTERNSSSKDDNHNETCIKVTIKQEKTEDQYTTQPQDPEKESNCDKKLKRRSPIKVDSKQALTLAALGLMKQRAVVDEGENNIGCCTDESGCDGLLGDDVVGSGTVGSGNERKIPRPANAFMLFANEWRKKLAVENPHESNKDISVRLGVMWKTMSKDVKEKYFELARQVDAEHKRKYPGKLYD